MNVKLDDKMAIVAGVTVFTGLVIGIVTKTSSLFSVTGAIIGFGFLLLIAAGVVGVVKHRRRG